ncbi:MAG: hypothetical protein LH603_07210, partial [Pseudonocardia sp.]|nr:hypothetical protein [Pseudonocardia sp.]
MTTTMPPPTRAPVPPGPGPRHRRPRRIRARVIALLVALAMVWPTVSYARALTYPGDASFLVRSVEWVRDHSGGGLVDTVENWWFAQGPTGPPDPASVPAPAPA